MKIERVVDESYSAIAYFTKGHVHPAHFAVAMVDWLNQSTDPDEYWCGDPPWSEVHHGYWRVNVQAPGAPWPFVYVPGTKGRQGSFPVTYFCYEGDI
jgi:hypothetical protein